MEELKTLKDLEVENKIKITPRMDFVQAKFVFSEEVKAEAIRWHKNENDFPDYFKEHNSNASSSDMAVTDAMRVAVQQFIEKFFNITEDDLK